MELEQNSFDNTDDYNAFDAGSAIGLGAIFTLKEMLNISIEVRNYTGVVDISDYEYFDSDPIRTMSTMLLIGVSHNIGKSTKE